MRQETWRKDAEFFKERALDAMKDPAGAICRQPLVECRFLYLAHFFEKSCKMSIEEHFGDL